MDPDFLVAVAVDVPYLGPQTLAPPQLPFSECEVAPDRFPEVGEVQAAEYSMPISIVTLSPSDCAAGQGWVAGLAEQDRERLHFLVHPVGLRILHQEVAPMRPPDQGAIGAGDAGLAQVTLQTDQPERRIGGK